MATVFHEGRKVLRTEIKNNNFANIADFLYFRIQISKYKDKSNNIFFLLPNIEYLVKETGLSKRTCERALQYLEKSDFISKARTRCYDGAVRLKIFITKKFKQIMDSISKLVNKKVSKNYTSNISKQDIISLDNHNSDSVNMADSDSVNMADSIIKVEDIKEDNNINSNIDIEEKQNIVKNVNFSLEDKNTFELADILADKYKFDCNDILFALVDLNESGLYNCKLKLIEDAIKIVKRNYTGEDILPTGEVFNSYKAIQVAEDTRDDFLTAKQQIAIHQMLKYLNNKGKALISNVKEVFSWIEFQIINPKHQLKGLGFKHCLNIIRNLLCDSSKQQYSKPVGFKRAPSS